MIHLGQSARSIYGYGLNAPLLNKVKRGMLSGGLAFYLGAGQPRELVTGLHGSNAGYLADRMATPYGVGTVAVFNPEHTRHASFTTGPWSVAVTFYVRALSNSMTGWAMMSRSAWTSESNNQGWSLNYAGTNSRNRFDFISEQNSGATFYAMNCGSLTTGLIQLVGTSNGSNLRTAYKNAVSQSTATVNTNPLEIAIAGQGQLQLGTIFSPTGDIVSLWGAGWNRELTQADINLLYANILNPAAILGIDMALDEDSALHSALVGGGGAGGRSQIILAG